MFYFECISMPMKTLCIILCLNGAFFKNKLVPSCWVSYDELYTILWTEPKNCSFESVFCFYLFNILAIISHATSGLRNNFLFPPLHIKSTVAVAMAIMIAHN